MEMRINISTAVDLLQISHNQQIISSLVWSHNGTELTSDSRVSIGNNGTSLTIFNMVQSDAGKYQVKFNSTGLSDREICDRNILPMLANLASHAPVIFVLQESSVPTYYPGDVISDYALPAYQGPPHNTLVIANVLMINVPEVAVRMNTKNRYEFLYKDGDRIEDMSQFQDTVSYDNVTTQSLRVTYNNTEDVAGCYSHRVYTQINYTVCPDWEVYSNTFGYIDSPLLLFTLYWNIRSYSELILQNAYFNS